MTSYRRWFLPLAVLLLMGQGCLGGTPKKAAGPDGGVFRTKNDGAEWRQLKVLNLETRLGSIADLATVSAALDPQEEQAMYVGTIENGLIYSMDGGEAWRSAKGLSIGRVNAVAVDSRNKCVVYVARGNQIMKTSNCMRDWNEINKESRAEVTFTALAVDWFNPSVVYVGTSAGDLYRSENGGASWRVAERVTDLRINHISVDPRDSRNVYVATRGAGILKSSDAGLTWKRIVEPFQNYDYSRSPVMVVPDPNIAGRVYNISKYGILKSEDGGASWSPLPLPTPPSSVDIRAFAVNPLDSQSRRLVYSTDVAVVFSNDGGKTWSSKKSPTARGASFLIFNHLTEQSLYLGAAQAKK